jgi:hypothetical protein
MKMKMKKIISLLLVASLAVACSEVLDISPQASYNDENLKNEAGIDGLLTGAYSRLHAGDYKGFQNWVFGSIAAEDAFKGSNSGDQPPINTIETYTAGIENDYARDKWNTVYGNIAACNRVLYMIKSAPGLPADFVKVKSAEARFLRAINFFELKKVFGNPAWIDENDLDENNPYKSNDFSVTKINVWDKIVEDLDYGIENLPAKPAQVGRAYQWAAKAFKAKAYMFQQKYAQAKPILEEIIMSGMNAKGVKYGLVPKLYDVYNIETKNNQESVFALQSSVFDGSNGDHGNLAMRLNYPYGKIIEEDESTGSCCGFFQPTYNLVNSYKVDANGLPFADYNKENLKNDQGIESSSPFTPDTTTPVDPRLDWTVGRRGIPYLDWGNARGKAVIRDQNNGGPYLPKKHMYLYSQRGQYVEYDWSPRTAMNYEIIRFADVLLWAAECEVEVGSVAKAMGYVNQVRARANNPENYIKKLDGTGNAANYKVGMYPTSLSVVDARKAVHFERKLEFAMEGHRFFDLVRWGEAQSTLNTFVEEEKGRQSYFTGVSYKSPKNDYMPIPEEAIRKSIKDGKPTLIQNPGH